MSIMKDDLAIRFNGNHPTIIESRQKLFDLINTINYPKIGKIKLDSFQFDDLNVNYIKEEKVNEIPSTLMPFVDDTTNCIIMKDGNIIYNNLDENFQGIELVTFHEALMNNDEKALSIFQKNFEYNGENKLRLLNAIYLNSGLIIRIPKNAVVKEALKLYILGENSDLVHHTYLIAEQSSEFTLVEKYDNLKTIKANIVTESFVHENAKVNYIAIDRFCEDTVAYIERNGYVYDHATLIYALGQLNDGNTVSYNNIQLLGKDSYSETRNVLLTDKDKTHAVTINMEHLAPFSKGEIINHGIVKDQAYLHIDGIGKIHQGMKNSNAHQTTSVITLSNEAKVAANPFLLIDEYDVLAGHGAGIGQVDEEQLYYLMSRGLSKREAEKLIILGFLYPIIELIESDQIKESFINTIEKKLSI